MKPNVGAALMAVVSLLDGTLRRSARHGRHARHDPRDRPRARRLQVRRAATVAAPRARSAAAHARRPWTIGTIQSSSVPPTRRQPLESPAASAPGRRPLRAPVPRTSSAAIGGTSTDEHRSATAVHCRWFPWCVPATRPAAPVPRLRASRRARACPRSRRATARRVKRAPFTRSMPWHDVHDRLISASPSLSVKNVVTSRATYARGNGFVVGPKRTASQSRRSALSSAGERHLRRPRCFVVSRPSHPARSSALYA